MKLPKLFLALLLFFVSFQICGAQEKKPKTELFDYFGAVGCEDILGRLDNFLVTIRNEPGAVGYVVFYGGANPIQNSYYKRAINNHPKMRRFDENRFKFIETNPLPSELKVELWLGRNGEKPAVEENKTGLVLNRISNRYPFAENTFEVVKLDGRLTYIHTCAVCCVETIDLNLLSEYLKANPAMRVEIRVYSNTKNRANQFINLFQRELKEDFKIPSHRLKIVYAGIDEGIAELPGKLSTVKIWLVPKGEKK